MHHINYLASLLQYIHTATASRQVIFYEISSKTTRQKKENNLILILRLIVAAWLHNKGQGKGSLFHSLASTHCYPRNKTDPGRLRISLVERKVA